MSTFELSRRSFLTRASAAVATTAFGTGASIAQTVPAPVNTVPEGAKFRWIDSGDQKAVFFKKFFEKYGEARGIDVIYDPLPWNEIAKVVPLGVRNNTAHDVFVLPRNFSLADAVSQGWVQPYDEFIPNIEEWKKASRPERFYLASTSSRARHMACHSPRTNATHLTCSTTKPIWMQLDLTLKPSR